MASLIKRNKRYSIIFKKQINGQVFKRTFSLGTTHKDIALKKKIHYEKLYQRGEINPFDENWNLQEFEAGELIDNENSYSPFIDHLKKQYLEEKTNATDKTKQSYSYIIDLFHDHVGFTMPITRINDRHIRTFCTRPTLATASQDNYFRALKTFFNWLIEKEILEVNPCDKIHLKRPKDNLVNKIIEESDLQELFSVFREYQLEQQKAGAIKTYGQKQFWFKPLITLAFYTGLRRKEIIQLRWSHVNLEDRFIRVTDTKNGLERTVPIFDPLYWRLKAWQKFMKYPKKRSLVFPSPKSTPKMEIALTGHNVSGRFKFYARKANFKETIHFHGLRHSCATFLLRNGFNVIETKNMLGHEKLEVTNRYVHLVANDLMRSAQRNGLITPNK